MTILADVNVDGKSLTLDECIRTALEAHPSRRVSLLNLDAAQERITGAGVAYYPSVKLQASYENKLPEEVNIQDSRVNIKQLIFDAGSTLHQRSAARHIANAQRQDVNRTEQDIVLGVKVAFFDVLKRKELIEVARATLKASEARWEQANQMYQQGVSPKSDEIKMAVQVSNAKLEVIKADNAYILSKLNLTVAMGLKPTPNYDVQGDPGSSETLPSMDVNELTAIALRNRSEILSSHEKISSGEATVRQARSGRLPNLSLEGSYGNQRRENLSAQDKWSVALTVSVPLFDQPVIGARIREAVAAKSALQEIDEQLRLSVTLEIWQAWLAQKEALEKRTTTALAVEQAKEDVKVSDGRYKEGVGNIIELTDAQTALTQAETNNIVAVYEISNSRARLERALGTGTRNAP